MAEWGPTQLDDVLSDPDGFMPVDQEQQGDWIEDDLAWILDKFAHRVMADGALLTLHRNDDAPELLARINRAKRPTSLANIMSLLVAQPTLSRSVQRKGGITWLKPSNDWGGARAMTVAVADDGEMRLQITVTFGRGNLVQEFASEQIASKLVPVLAGYFRLWLHTRRQQRRMDALQAALDVSDVATVILDSNGAVVGENKAATAMFRQKDVVRKSRHALSAVCRGETPKIHSAMDAVMSEGGQSAPFSLSRQGYGRPLMSVVSSIEKRPEISSDPSFILCIYDSEKDLGPGVKRCCDAYGLTRTEARLVEQLVAGSTLAESAGRMRIAEATARSYLKQIFAKTETNRQSELIKVMLLSLARTAEERIAQ